MRVRTFLWRIAASAGMVAIATTSLAAQASKSPADTTAKAADTKTAADSTAKPDSAATPVSPLPSLGPSTLLAAGELGYRAFLDKPPATAMAKLIEYKAVPTGPVLLNMLLNYTAADSISVYQLNGTNIGERDQSLQFRGNNPGVFDLQARWDRIPHTFSTNARSFGSEQSPGVYVLPVPRPDSVAWRTNAPYLPAVRTLWNATKALAAYTPSPNWDLRTEYTNIGKTGRRPMGMAMGSPGANLREIQEPIDQTMQDLKFTEGYSNPTFQVFGFYNLSLFHNGFTSVTADNPLVSTDGATTGSSRGRTALAPTNHAHTGVLNAALALPRNTRINASGSYSLWIQDEPFIPVTINSAISSPLIASLPTHLNGRSGTSSFSLSGVSRPIAPLTLTARVRTFSFRDQADVDSMAVFVVNDRSIGSSEDRDFLPFTRRNADAGATWRVTRIPLTLSAGYGWEGWKRSEARNVADLREGSPRVSADYNVVDWMSIRASYTTGRRRIHGEYVQNTTTDQALHRRFDQADRDRERSTIIATITPVDQIIMSGTWTVGHDEYPNSTYGLQSDRNNMLGGDLSWSPSPRFSVDGSYSAERFLTRIRSQYRVPGQLNNPTYNWVANNRDEIRTASGGFRAVLIPERLEAGARIDASKAKFRMATYNPVLPTGGTAAQNFAATASDLPLVTQTYQPMSAYATYYVNPEWAMTARFDGERWAQNDFRTINLLPWEGNGVFLGNNLDNYNARYFSISVSYRPRLLRIHRPTL